MCASSLLYYERKPIHEIDVQVYDYSPGQAWALQRCVCSFGPRQSLPPLAGDGLLHFLIRI